MSREERTRGDMAAGETRGGGGAKWLLVALLHFCSVIMLSLCDSGVASVASNGHNFPYMRTYAVRQEDSNGFLIHLSHASSAFLSYLRA